MSIISDALKKIESGGWATGAVKRRRPGGRPWSTVLLSGLLVASLALFFLARNSREPVVPAEVFSPAEVVVDVIRESPQPAPPAADETAAQTTLSAEPVMEARETKPKEIRERPVFQLGGIILGGDVPLAIINDRIVTVGEKIEGASLLSISERGVELLLEDEKIDLYLH